MNRVLEAVVAIGLIITSAFISCTPTPTRILPTPTPVPTVTPTPIPTCAPTASPPTPTATPAVTPVSEQRVQEAMRRALEFLRRQYNLTIGLLEESPDIGKHNFYLTNDNALAAYTLETLGVENELAATLRTSLEKYGCDHNGFIEVAWGEPIRWPPYHHKDCVVEQIGADRILCETHEGRGYFYDWSAYSNLAFMAALNEHNQGFHQSALRLWQIEMGTFDGAGWQDKAYWDRKGVYETIGPAWALYVGFKIGAPMDYTGPALVEALLQKQGPSGGFHTHYREPHKPEADPNVETTSLVLLGLNAYLDWVRQSTAMNSPSP